VDFFSVFESFGLVKQVMEFKTFLKHFSHFLNGFWVS